MTRDSVRAIARGEAVVGGSVGFIDLTGADLSYADLSFATMTCLYGCPIQLTSGYICEPDLDCLLSNRNRIVEE